MSDERPDRRSLKSAKKEAKRWLDALRAQDANALARLHRLLPNTRSAPTLRDVQHALALEHGFAGWEALKQSVANALATDRGGGAGVLSRYEEMAEALLAAYRTGTPEAMERHYRHTWHRRPWSGMRTYVQLDLGKRPALEGDEVDITLADARTLVAREHGFSRWADLQAFTRTSLAGARLAAKPVRLVSHDEVSPCRALASSRDWDEIIRLLGSGVATGLNADGQMTDAILEDVSRVEGVTRLNLSGSNAVTDEGVRHLAGLTSLRHLDLSGTRVTDRGLQVLRVLPHLRSLSLAWTKTTDHGVTALVHCDELERLNLTGTAAGDGALRSLAGKSRLSHLNIALTDAGLPGLHELPVYKSWHGGEAELTLVGRNTMPNHLSLRGTFTNRGLLHMRGLNGLFSLDINEDCHGVSAGGLQPLESLPHLGAVSLDAKDDWMPYIAALPHLRFFSAQDTTAGDDGFVALSRSRSLEYIWGRRCHSLRGRGFRALAEIPTLRGLSVSCLNVDDDALSVLPSFPTLRELMPMDVPDLGYRHIGRCERLESLVLMYCRETTDAATEHIAGLRLGNYFNSYTTITDRTPELLSTMDSLNRITFDACHGLTNDGVARLAKLPQLRELRASGRGITAALRSAFKPGITVITEA